MEQRSVARRRIVCINRRMRHEDPERHISHVGIGGEGGFSQVLMVEEVLAHLRAEDGHRYYVRGGDGWEAEVKLGQCLFCAGPHEFLRSAPDLQGADKLLTLPVCGDS